MGCYRPLCGCETAGGAPGRTNMIQRAVSALIAAVVLAAGLPASTVVPVSVREMAGGSEFVFEGRVILLEAVRPEGSKNIFTRVLFEVTDVLKGDHDRPTVALDFMGGTIGSLTLSISDLQLPKKGERGIYFVESRRRRQVHPLYGWNQGRFLILDDRDGNPRVHTARGRPVRSVGEAPAPGVAALRAGVPDAALGVEVAADPAEDGNGLSPAEFKRRLRDLGGWR